MSLPRERLLSVVKGDWSPYRIDYRLITTGTAEGDPILHGWDFNLLRSDLNIVLYEAAPHTDRDTR